MFAAQFQGVLQKRRGLALGFWGEAGVGKTYSVTQLLKSLPCDTFSAHATLELSTLTLRLPRPKKLSLWVEQTITCITRGDTVDKTRSLDALSAVLAGLTPFVLHLEDIHETDATHLAWIQELAEIVLRIKGLALIVTGRRQPPEPFTKLRLKPLDHQGSDQLLEQELGTSLPQEACQWIYQRARGNPLYSLEYLRYLTRQGSLWNDGHTWNWRKPAQDLIPVSVETLIEMQLTTAMQNPEYENALQARALLPLDIADPVWAKVAGSSLDALTQAKQAFIRDGIFGPDQFAHPLYREIILKNLSSTQRHYLSGRALEALRNEPVKAAMFIEDASLEPRQALELFKEAAQLASTNQDQLLAGRLLAHAVKHASGEARGLLALQAAQLLEGLDVPLALQLADQAATALNEPSEALYLKALLLAGQSEYEHMWQVVAQLPETFRTGPTWIAKQIHLLYLAGQDQARIKLWEDHPEIHASCDGATANFMAWAYLNLGKTAEAFSLIERVAGIATLSDLDQCNILEARATLHFYSGNYPKAESDFSQALMLRQRLGYLPATANVIRNRSMTRLQQGYFRESLGDFEQAVAIYSTLGKIQYYAETLVMMSHPLIELGQYERSETILLEALEILRRAEPHPILVDLLVQLASVYLAWGGHAHSYLARKYAREAERVAAAFSANSRLQVTLTLARVEPDAQRALAYATEAIELATHLSMLEAIVNGHYTRGLTLLGLGQKEDAKASFMLACQLALEHGLVVEANKYSLEIDRLDHDLESAKQRVSWFNERGLVSSLNLARRYFPELFEGEGVAKQPSSSGLHVLGPLQFHYQGKTVAIRGSRRQSLIALLLDARMAGRPEVPRLELQDSLYPEDDEVKASQNIKALIYGLRKLFGEGLIFTTHTGYSLGDIPSDAEEFLETFNLNLWRGAYLQGCDIVSQRVQDSLYLSLYETCRAQVQTASKEVARVAPLLLLAEPYNTSYLALNLQALRRRENYKALKQVYQEARARFAEVGEELPENWLEFLALTDKTP